MPKSEKHGGMHSAVEKDKLQAIHDHAASMGANCGGMAEGEAKGIKYSDVAMAMPGMEIEDNPPDDVRTAAYAIANLCELMESEDDEPDDLKEITALIRGLMAFIEGELKEAESGEDEEKSFAKVAKREEVNPKRGEKEYGDVKFADEKNKKYPIDTEEHIRAAYNYINKTENAGKYSAEDVATIKRKIIAAWKEKIDKDGPPSADKKGLDLSYIKALGLVIPDNKLAVKFVGRDEIAHPVFLWGSPNKLDIEKDFFNQDTDFWDETFGKSPRPLTWDHGQDVKFKDPNPVVGKTVEWNDDDMGRWAVSVLNKDKAYRKFLDEFIEQKAVGTSSDSAPQYVIREKQGKGFWIKQWPWFASAITPIPAEPRMKDFAPEFLKAWNLDGFPEAHDNRARKSEILMLRERELKLKSKGG